MILQGRERWNRLFVWMAADWMEIADGREADAWFICRYGRQDFEKVIEWPISRIASAVRHLGKFIADENPNPGSGQD